MKAVVIGLGSMGKRRIRCLQALGHQVLFASDPRGDRRAEAARLYGVATRAAIAAPDLAQADAVVVSTPPDLHARFLSLALDAGKPCFTEAGVTLDDLPELERRARRRGVLVFPSCTMRYFAGPRKVHELVRSGRIGKPLSFIYHSGQYLPDWHPWERVSQFYVSRARTGACREIVPFELTWLTWVFGRALGVRAQQAQFDRFGPGVEDIYQALARFSSGVLGMLQVDVLARSPIRRFSLETTKGRLVWDQYRPEGPGLVWQPRGKKPVAQRLREYPGARKGIHSDGPYIRELGDFLDAARRRRRQPDYRLADDIAILRTLERIRRQSHGKAL